MNEKLQQVRKQKKLSQKEAAKLCDMPFRTYQSYELGREPKVSVAFHMASSLCVKVEEIFNTQV